MLFARSREDNKFIFDELVMLWISFQLTGKQQDGR